jgi:hypothetical protein
MVELAGPAAGRTFHTFFIDSWEAGGQNWTEEMPAEFKRRRGYDPRPYLPVLSGRVLGDLQTSERFLYDLRLTVSELATANFWAELRRLCNARGMRLATQTYITTGNDFDAANHTDEPMGEFWCVPNVPGNDYSRSIKIASSAANLNNQSIVGAEAFTSTDQERWLSHPATLKEKGDRMFCMGANRFQIHRFAMQRFPQLSPGMTMSKWGQHYDSTQTWWEWSKPWHDYLARCQYLLRSGPIVTDVLVLTPEEPLWRYEHEPVPGHDFDVCGPDTFNRITMVNGKPGIEGGPVYQLITLKHCARMSVGRLRKLRNLVASGAALLGEPPTTTPGLEDLPDAGEELKALVAEIWGNPRETERAFGKGRVFRGMPTAEALDRLGVTPDFKGPDHLSWIHRKSAGMDIYFVTNPLDKPTRAKCAFRITGRHAELWDPETGGIRPIESSPTGGKLTQLDITLGPSGSAFIVFRDHSNAATPVIAAEPATRSPRTLDGPWTVRFPKSGVEGNLQFDKLISWSQHPDPRIRHFSGTATYTCGFVLNEKPSSMLLDLGRVEIMARVRLNGNDLGILWKPPYQTDISRHVRTGTNQLEIEVVNLWVNRMIGDESLPPDSKRDALGILTEWPQWVLDGSKSPSGRTTFATFPLWKKTDQLQPSGLLGPVMLK